MSEVLTFTYFIVQKLKSPVGEEKSNDSGKTKVQKQKMAAVSLINSDYILLPCSPHKVHIVTYKQISTRMLDQVLV